MCAIIIQAKALPQMKETVDKKTKPKQPSSLNLHYKTQSDKTDSVPLNINNAYCFIREVLGIL